VSDSNHVVDADVWCDGNIAGEIEMHLHQDELIERHQVMGCDQWYMQNEHQNVFVGLINVGSFDEKEIGRFIDKVEHLALGSDLIDICDDFKQSLMVEGFS
jgi:hypothetical protein